MKKHLSILSILLLVILPLSAQIKASKVKIEVIDREGLALGMEIPEWVKELAIGGNEKVKTILNIPTDQYTFMFQCRGDAKDGLQKLVDWTDNIEIYKEICDSIVKTVSSSEVVNEDENQAIKTVQISSMTAVPRGVKKVASYWMRLSKSAQNKKTFDDYYEYYVVYTVPKSEMQTAIEKVINETVNDSTLEAKNKLLNNILKQ